MMTGSLGEGGRMAKIPKRCPVCGGQVELEQDEPCYWLVVCPNCRYQGPPCLTMSQAVEKHNSWRERRFTKYGRES